MEQSLDVLRCSYIVDVLRINRSVSTLSSSSSSGRNGGINELIASKDDSWERREGRKAGSRRRRSWLLSTRWWSSLVVQLLGVCLLSKLHGHAALQAQIYVDGSVYDWEQTNDRSDPLSLLPRRKNKGGWWKEKEGIRRGSLDETRFLPPENHRERKGLHPHYWWEGDRCWKKNTTRADEEEEKVTTVRSSGPWRNMEANWEPNFSNGIL